MWTSIGVLRSLMYQVHTLWVQQLYVVGTEPVCQHCLYVISACNSQTLYDTLTTRTFGKLHFHDVPWGNCTSHKGTARHTCAPLKLCSTGLGPSMTPHNPNLYRSTSRCMWLLSSKTKQCFFNCYLLQRMLFSSNIPYLIRKLSNIAHISNLHHF